MRTFSFYDDGTVAQAQCAVWQRLMHVQIQFPRQLRTASAHHSKTISRAHRDNTCGTNTPVILHYL